MPATITVKPWNDPLVDTLGHDPRSLYVETFWLPTLGPTALLLMRHLATRFDRSPSGIDLLVADTSLALGLGRARGVELARSSAASRGSSSSTSRAPTALVDDRGPSQPPAGESPARPPSPRRRAGRARGMGRSRARGAAARRRPANAPRRVALTLLEQGDDLDHVEHLLHSTRVPSRGRRRGRALGVDAAHRSGTRSRPAARRLGLISGPRPAGPPPFGRPRRRHSQRRCLTSRAVTDVETIAGVAARRARDRRPHRRRASRPSRASPTSAARRACGRRTPRPRRPRRSQYYVSDPEVRQRAWQNRLEQRDLDRRAERRRTARSPSSSARPRCTRSSPRTSTGCTTRPGTSPETDRRDPRHRARGEVPGVRLARARWTRRSTGSRAGEDDPACLRVRRDPEVGDDQLRREPRARGPRRGPSARPRRRRVPRRSARRSASTRPPRCPRSRSRTAPAS